MRLFALHWWVRALAAVVALSTLTACYSWRAESPHPQLPPGHGKDMRLTLENGQRLVLYRATLGSDSVRGSLYETRLHQLAVPTRDIVRFEFRQLSPAKTVAYTLGMTALVGAFVGAVAGAIWLATWDGPFGSCGQ